MTPRTGLAGAVVQRSLADWPVVLAAWLLLVCATTLLATGVVYGDAVATGGLHRAIAAAPPADRAIEVVLTTDPARLEGLDRVIRPELERAIATTGGDVVRVARTGSFGDAGGGSDDQALTVLASLDGIESRATLTSGTWPVAGGRPVEASLSEGAARAMGLAAGDRLRLASRLDPTMAVEVVISGIWTADAADAVWLGDALETSGETTSGTFTTRGPLFVREADILGVVGGATGGGAAGANRLTLSWRAVPAIGGLGVDEIDRLRADADAVAGRLRGILPVGSSARVATRLPAVLDEIGRSVLVSRSGVILLTIQFAVLAGYAIVLVAGMLVERRRAEIALLRSRGASSVHLVLMSVLEAAILAVPATALAPILAIGIVGLLGAVGPTAGLGLTDGAAIGPAALALAALAGLASIVALVLPTLLVAAGPAGARAAQGRQSRTTLPQRLGLDLALVVVAGIALWQLRLYGAPLTRTARGTLGLDPLLVAAPAIGLVAGAVLALRVVPRIAELGEGLLARGRGLVGALGGRQLARRPLRYTRAALLLMLAAALGTLAAAHGATWARSQADQAAHRAVGDIRVVASDYSSLSTWAAGPRYRAIDGVRAAVPVTIVPFDIGRTVRDGSVVGLDPVAASTIGSGRDDGATAGALAALEAARVEAPVVALPGEPRRIALTVDAAFQQVERDGPVDVPAGTAGLEATVIVRDGDGRLFRTDVAKGSLFGAGQRLVVSLGEAAPGLGGSPLRPAGPFAIAGVELLVRPEDPIVVLGAAELLKVESSEAATGDGPWTTVPLDPAAPDWRWVAADASGTTPFTPPPDRPGRVSIGQNEPVFGGPGATGLTFRLLGGGPRAGALPAVASRTVLERTGRTIGEELSVTSLGRPLRVRIVAAVELLAPYDPDAALLVVDLGALDAARFATTGGTHQADEWWLAVAPGSEPTVLAALRERGLGVASAVGRAELTRALSTDPVPLGLIGILGLGSIAALLFAGIGFLVSATISTSERVGEFALLRALGLSTRQLSLWLSIESVFLLVVGLVAGSALGLLLAWLVLPFATLTQTGLPPVPAPVVIVPWEAILPIPILAAVLFLVSLALARRQLPDVRISGVLRAREG